MWGSHCVIHKIWSVVGQQHFYWSQIWLLLGQTSDYCLTEVWIFVGQQSDYCSITHLIIKVKDLIICWCRNLVGTSTKLRPSFDTQCRSLVSKFARYMNATHGKVKVVDQMSTKCRHQTSTKLRHLGVEVWSNVIICWSNLFMLRSTILLFLDQQCDYCLTNNMIIVWSNIWLFVDQTYDCFFSEIWLLL